MKPIDRLYWFSKNLAALILSVIVSPFSFIFLLAREIKTLTITDGSEQICFPWEYDWKWGD